ncbi:MAG: hypothetical protein WC955_10625 [Elusimicrobiota bacterium]
MPHTALTKEEQFGRLEQELFARAVPLISYAEEYPRNLRLRTDNRTESAVTQEQTFDDKNRKLNLNKKVAII